MSYSILIVDDSATTRAIIKRTIKIAGIDAGELVEAPDGLAALKLLQQKPIDLILLDLNMPNMTGMELTRTIRADPKFSSTKIIIVSSESTAARIEQLRNDGVNGYVKKPFTPEQIRNVINTVIGVANAA